MTDELTPDERQTAATVQALRVAAALPPDALGYLAAAAMFVMAIDTGTTPADSASTFAASVGWPTDDEWKVEGPRVTRTVKNTRRTYTAAMTLTMKRPQG